MRCKTVTESPRQTHHLKPRYDDDDDDDIESILVVDEARLAPGVIRSLITLL